MGESLNKLIPKNGKTGDGEDGSQDGDEEEDKSPMEIVKDTFKLMVSGRMMMVMPLIIFSGMNVSIFANVFIPLMVRSMHNSLGTNIHFGSVTFRNKTALLCQTLLGVGEILGGLIVGRIQDKAGHKVTIVSLCVLLGIGVSMVILLNERNKFDVVAYLMTFFWGI